MLTEQLKKARHNLGVAIEAARDAGKIQREALDAGTSTAASEETFQKAFTDVKKHKKTVEELDAMQQVEEAHEELSKPVDSPIIVTSPGAEEHTVSPELHHAVLNAYFRVKASGGVNPMRQMIQAAERHGGGAEEVHALISGDDSLGGFTVPEDFRAEVIREIAGQAVVRRAGARSVTTNTNNVSFPVVKGASTNPKMYTSTLLQGDGNWKGEAYVTGGTAPTIQNNPTFGLERIPVHSWQPDAIELTPELLEDTAIDLEGIIRELISEVRILDEDITMLLGDGVGKPEGIMESGADTVVIGDASTYTTPVSGDNGISYPRVVNVYIDLAAQYRQNATWVMNSDTFGLILKLEDDNERPIFPLNALPGTLLTRPMVFTEFLPNLDTNLNKSVIFGDFSKYVIAERRELTIQRLVERYAPNLGLLPSARVGGQVVLPVAFRIGTVQA